MYDADDVVATMATEPWVVVTFFVAMAFGFIQYVYSLVLERREGHSPFPVWMHTFYLAHDLLFVVLVGLWFGRYDLWALQLVWLGMVVFLGVEVISLTRLIRHDRQAVFGGVVPGLVSVRAARVRVVALVAFCFIAVGAARDFLGDTVMLTMMASTNVVMVLGPLLDAERWRPARTPARVQLALWIVAGTVVTFLPPGVGFWTTAAPEAYDRPWFYAVGAAALVAALRHLVVVLGGRPASSGRTSVAVATRP